MFLKHRKSWNTAAVHPNQDKSILMQQYSQIKRYGKKNLHPRSGSTPYITRNLKIILAFSLHIKIPRINTNLLTLFSWHPQLVKSKNTINESLFRMDRCREMNQQCIICTNNYYKTIIETHDLTYKQQYNIKKYHENV